MSEKKKTLLGEIAVELPVLSLVGIALIFFGIPMGALMPLVEKK